MRSGLIVVLTLAASAALALPSAEAGAFKPAQASGFKQAGHLKQVGGFGHHGGFNMKVGDGNPGGGQGFGNGGAHFPTRPFPGNPPFKHQRPFWPYRNPNVVYLAPPYFVTSTYTSSAYDSDPGYAYAPGPAYSAYPSTNISMSVPPPPPTPPAPSAIDYPQGRYELRGDGYWTPYSWEWVSKVPPPPPGPPPMAYGPPPGMAPPTTYRPAGDQPEPSRRALYRWTDDQGVVNFTDNVETIPAAYRAQAKKLTP